MMDVDIAVRMNGRTYRLITNGDRAGLFSGHGSEPVRLDVTAPGANIHAIPALSGPDGPAALARASRPCSCTGAPWNLGVAGLRAQLT